VAQQLIKRSDGSGRYPAIEIMLNTPLVSDIIRKGEVHRLKEVMRTGKEQGMQTFDQALLDLYMSGKISYDDALNSADSKNEVRLAIKLASEASNSFSSDDNIMSLAAVDDREGRGKRF
jgi:twitching motility protein PilU